MKMLFNIARKMLFSKQQDRQLLPHCFVATDVDTQVPAIHYLTESGKHYTVDGNSVVRIHLLTNNTPINDLLETSQAEEIKREVVSYYQMRKKNIPEQFHFLKAYQIRPMTKSDQSRPYRV